MRPLNRHVKDLAKQMETVKERVASLRTSIHTKSKKGSIDYSQIERRS